MKTAACTRTARLHRRERRNAVPALPLSPLPARKRCEPGDRSTSDATKSRHRRTLLVPVDFTESSLKALDYALSVARRHNATVTLFHVLEGAYGDGLLDSSVRAKERTRAIEDARMKLHLLAATRMGRGVPMECVVKDGNAEFEILRFAEIAPARLIVLGRKTRNALSRFIFGSVTKGVIETSPCPVVVVPDRESNAARKTPRVRRGTFSCSR